jgi:PTS system nitrogen regulatory IIA component
MAVDGARARLRPSGAQIDNGQIGNGQAGNGQAGGSAVLASPLRSPTGVRTMTDLIEVLAPAAILPRVHASSKRQALQTLCDALAEAAGLDPRTVFDAVQLRERLSGTGMGEGVAIPHARVPGLDHPVGAFARFDPPVDFDALDGRPADLVFLLLAPEERGADHLKALAKVSRLLRKPDVRERLRAARGLDGLVAVFERPPKSDAA